MLVILRVTVISLCVCPVFCVAPHDQFFVKLRVPDGYFLEMQENPHKEFGTRPDCAFGCAAEAGCEAFVVRGGKCALGTMNMTNPNVPSFVPDGMDIMVKKDKVALNALSIPHIGSLTLDLDVPHDTAVVNATDFPPVQMPRYPGKEAGGSIFGVTNYKSGLVACGGTSGGATVKTCRRWSFHSGEWTEMRGELWDAHFDGGARRPWRQAVDVHGGADGLLRSAPEGGVVRNGARALEGGGRRRHGAPSGSLWSCRFRRNQGTSLTHRTCFGVFEHPKASSARQTKDLQGLHRSTYCNHTCRPPPEISARGKDFLFQGGGLTKKTQGGGLFLNLRLWVGRG